MRWLLHVGGWFGAAILIVVFLLSEFIPVWIGGDLGGFLYVTFHFILVPLLSICVVVLTVIKTFQIKAVGKKLGTFLSAVVPIAILYLAVTGSAWLPRLLNIHFN